MSPEAVELCYQPQLKALERLVRDAEARGETASLEEPGMVEELVEMLTWAQLGIHDKPSGLLNVGGYFDSLMAFFDRGVEDRFLQPEHRKMLLVEEEPADLLDRLVSYESPKVDKAKWALGLEEA